MIGGKVYRNSEAPFHAAKFPDNPEWQEAIRNAKTPFQANKMGRSRLYTLRKDWDKVKDAVMLNCVREKFEQNCEIATILIATEPSILVEHTKRDSYWGDGGDGSGRNQLGKTLMQVRSELIDALLKIKRAKTVHEYV